MSPFTGGTTASKPTSLPDVPSKPADAVAPRSKVIITTYGPFRYDVAKEHAQFDIPPSSGALEEKVMVTRYHPVKMRTLLERLLEPPVTVEWQSEDLLDLMARRHPAPKQDVLRCDHLELQFHRKSATSQKPGSEDRSADLEIESAHATGKLVTIRSDSDNFKAEGDDFTFVAQDRLSILKGDQKIRAAKDGTRIVARELHLLDKTGAQQVKAVGPGAIEMYDRATHKSPHRARFDHELVSTREGTFDVITIRGNAALVDDEQLSIEMEDLFKDEELLKAKSLIKADSLKIWLEQSEPETSAPASASAPESRRRLHRLEAVGRVLVRSPETYIHDTDRLEAWFKDAVPAKPSLTQASPDAGGAQAGERRGVSPPLSGQASPAAGGAQGGGNREQKADSKPVQSGQAPSGAVPASTPRPFDLTPAR